MKSALDQITDCKPIGVDLQGWHSQDPIFQTIIDQVRPKRIIEVGSWKGASAVHMADLTRDLGTCIYCVDTWLGGVDHLLANDAGIKPAENHIQRLDGYPQLYHQFLHNVRESGHGDRIFPLPQTSTNGARYLRAKGIAAELIYLDGSHEFEDVALDILMYLPLLAPGGVLLGDDWSFPGVQKAVVNFLGKKPEYAGEREGEFWTLRLR